MITLSHVDYVLNRPGHLKRWWDDVLQRSQCLLDLNLFANSFFVVESPHLLTLRTCFHDTIVVRWSKMWIKIGETQGVNVFLPLIRGERTLEDLLPFVRHNRLPLIMQQKPSCWEQKFSSYCKKSNITLLTDNRLKHGVTMSSKNSASRFSFGFFGSVAATLPALLGLLLCWLDGRSSRRSKAAQLASTKLSHLNGKGLFHKK